MFCVTKKCKTPVASDEMRANWQSPGDVEISFRNERGRDDYSVRQLCFSEGRPGLDPRVGESVNPSVFPLLSTTCAMSAISEDSLDTPPKAWTSSFRTPNQSRDVAGGGRVGERVQPSHPSVFFHSEFPLTYFFNINRFV